MKRFIYWLIAVLILLQCSATISALADDDLENLAAQKQLAEKNLLLAKAAFRKSLPTFSEYQTAQDRVDQCQDAIASLQKSHASNDEIDAAIKTKMSAQAAMKKLAVDLEDKDETVRKVQAKFIDVSKQLDTAQRAKAAVEWQERQERDGELARHKIELEKLRAVNGKQYREIVDLDYSKPLTPHDSIPLKGDEISFAEPTANPRKFVNNPFIVCCLIQISDFYHGAYSDSKSTHYSFGVTTLTADKHLGDSALAYLERSKGADLVDILAKRDKFHPDSPWVVRVQLTIDPNYFRTIQGAHNLYSLLDWQFLGPDGWSPWHSEVIEP